MLSEKYKCVHENETNIEIFQPLSVVWWEKNRTLLSLTWFEWFGKCGYLCKVFCLFEIDTSIRSRFNGNDYHVLLNFLFFFAFQIKVVRLFGHDLFSIFYMQWLFLSFSLAHGRSIWWSKDDGVDMKRRATLKICPSIENKNLIFHSISTSNAWEYDMRVLLHLVAIQCYSYNWQPKLS